MKKLFLAFSMLILTSGLSAEESDSVLTYLEEIQMEEFGMAIERAQIRKVQVDSEVVMQAEIVQSLEGIVARSGHGGHELDRALVRLIILQNSQRAVQFEIRANELRAEVVRTLRKLRTGESVEPGRVEALKLEDRNVRCEILKLDVESAIADLELQRRMQAVYDELANVRRAVPRSEWLIFAPKIAELEATVASLRNRASISCAR
jgi:hypothetical protein